MNELLLNKLDELFSELDATDDIKELICLKKLIYNDKDLSNKLDTIKAINNVYDKEYMELKKVIINNPLIQKFHKLEDELYFTVLQANQKLEQLFNKKGCQNARN